MKQIRVLAVMLLTTVFFTLPHYSSAQMGMMDNSNQATGNLSSDHSGSVEVVLQEILNQQQVSTINELDVNLISDDQWAILGDTLMEQYHPGEAHEAMDRMMGGEGSESLRAMHINMGKSYLGAGTYTGHSMTDGMMGMMNWSNTNNPTDINYSQWSSPMMGLGSMMGAGGFSGVTGVVGSITWIAVIAFLLSGTYFFIKKAGKK